MEKAFAAGAARIAAEAGRVEDAERIEAGADRLDAEAKRVEKMKADATPPDNVGPVPVAPARTSGFRETTQRTIVGGSAVRSGYQGPGEAAPRRTLVVADVFDRMVRDARSRHEANPPTVKTKRGEDVELAFIPPFTSGQIWVARHYRTLVERREAAGMKCASLEAGRAGGEGGGFMDAFLDVSRELAAMQSRIGDGFAMEVRRVRPSNRGGAGARTIRCRDLVDMVCLGDHSLSEVLVSHGWAKSTGNLASLRSALAAILSRM